MTYSRPASIFPLLTFTHDKNERCERCLNEKWSSVSLCFVTRALECSVAIRSWTVLVLIVICDIFNSVHLYWLLTWLFFIDGVLPAFKCKDLTLAEISLGVLLHSCYGMEIWKHCDILAHLSSLSFPNHIIIIFANLRLVKKLFIGQKMLMSTSTTAWTYIFDGNFAKKI